MPYKEPHFTSTEAVKAFSKAFDDANEQIVNGKGGKKPATAKKASDAKGSKTPAKKK